MENNNRNNKKNSIAMLMAAILIFCAGMFTATVKSNLKFGNIPDSTIRNLNRIDKLITENYYTDFDKNTLYKYAEEFMVYGLSDPYSYYLDEDGVEDFNEGITGNYVGIGLTLTPGENGEIKILAPFDGSPAKEAGVKPNDILTKVEGKEYQYDNIDEAVSIMRGLPGEKVTIEVLRDNSETLSFEIEKRKIEIASVTSEKAGDNIINIRISRFDMTTADDFKKELEKYELNEETGLILDLRDNPGGVVVSALEIADMFVDNGILLTEKYKNADDEVIKADKDKLNIKYPIVILGNGNSASASEIVTGAIKDHKAGVLIGETTYGKGILNQQFSIDGKSSLVLSIGEYTTPSGESIHEKGIAPDYEVLIPESLRNKSVTDLTPGEDVQLKKAVQFIKDGDIK